MIMTLDEVSKYLRCHNSTIYRLLKKKKLPAFKIGSDWRFDSASIDQWVKKQQEEEEGKENG